MGLISTTAEIGLIGTNIKWFKEKGYAIPRNITKQSRIEVSVNDLRPSSTAMVLIRCDLCSCEKYVTYGYYTRINHDGLCYCNKCSKIIFCGGSKNYCWNPNKTDEERETGRAFREYHNFIRKVLSRDNYTCFCCGNKLKTVEVHHLNSFNWFVNGRTDETNAVTLCYSCHKNFHNIYMDAEIILKNSLKNG